MLHYAKATRRKQRATGWKKRRVHCRWNAGCRLWRLGLRGGRVSPSTATGNSRRVFQQSERADGGKICSGHPLKIGRAEKFLDERRRKEASILLQVIAPFHDRGIYSDVHLFRMCRADPRAKNLFTRAGCRRLRVQLAKPGVRLQVGIVIGACRTTFASHSSSGLVSRFAGGVYPS